MDPDPLLSGLLSYGVVLISIGSPGLLIVLLLVLLAGSALLSASEVAFFSLSPQDVETLTTESSRAEKTIIKLKDRPRYLLATILISNNFINIAIVIISETLLRTLISDDVFNEMAIYLQKQVHLGWLSQMQLSSILSFLVTIVAVTFLLVLFGEVAPKIYANLNNVRHAKLMAGPLSFLGKVFFPFNKLLIKSSAQIEERVYRQRLQSTHSADRRELDKAIELTVTEEESQDEIDILKGIIKFGDVTTKQIMKSRVDVVGIDTSSDFAEVMKIVKQSGFSRLPVFEEDFDNIRGILYVKDLLGHTQEDYDYPWHQLIREQVLYIPEAKKIDDLLKEFQLKRTHLGIVVDEYGGSSGIVTLEDIMEEVVGDIKDEFDIEEEVDYVKIDDHNYVFEGKTLLNDVIRITDLEDQLFDEGKGHADTIAGLILELEGRIPKRDKVIPYKSIKLKVLAVNKRRIERVNITI